MANRSIVAIVQIHHLSPQEGSFECADAIGMAKCVFNKLCLSGSNAFVFQNYNAGISGAATHLGLFPGL